jgi:uncharacterized OB-fold protein
MPLPRPKTDFEELPFWTRGADSQLAIAHCADCGYWIHPPSPACPKCLTWNIHSEAVSGRGRIVSFTINRQQWLPDVPVPYVIAIVALVEQDDLRVAARIETDRPEDLEIDQEVDVAFQEMDGWVMPYFVPAAEDQA